MRACLASLDARQGASFEVILVDNGSTDGSLEMAASYPGIRIIKNSENRGFCAANNQGIHIARGEFIALLNNDAEAEFAMAIAQVCRIFRFRIEDRVSP